MSGWLSNGFSLATLPLTGNERLVADTQLSSGALPETEAVSMSQAFQYFGGGGTLPWVAGRFYGMPPSTTPVATLTTASVLVAYPLYIPATAIKTASVNVTTPQTGGNAHVGIYADNGAGYPGSLVYDFGAQGALTATGSVTVTPTTAVSLNSGLYWIASIYTATSTFPSVIGITSAYTNPLPAQLGFDTLAHAVATSGEAATGITVAGTYGALPATYPASATLSLNTTTPAVFFGV